MSSRQPNLLIIGAARSGTTALAAAIKDDPEVFFTDPKEMHFLAHVGTDRTYAGIGDDEMMNQRIIREPNAYEALFAGAGEQRYRAEGSVSTLCFPDVSIPAIQRYAAPDTKLIAVLRDPVARSYSAYLYLRSRGHEPAETFPEALELEAERIAAGYHHMWQYRSMSHYEKQLPAFADAFGDRLFIGVQEEFVAEPETFLAQVYDFLGLPGRTYNAPPEVNKGGEPRSAAIQRFQQLLRSNARVQETVKAATPYWLRERVRRMNLSQPELSASLRAQLRGEFAPTVERVEGLLGRPVPSWNPDS